MNYFIIIRGPLGSGKTTIAKKLSEILKGKYFAVDRILDKYNLTKDKEDGYISQKSFLKVNEVLIPKAKKFLDKNIPTIFDGNFYWKSQIEDLIKKMNTIHFVFTLTAPLEICIKRDKERNKTHGDDATKAVYKKSTEFDFGIVIDVTKSENDAVEKILHYIHNKKYRSNTF